MRLKNAILKARFHCGSLRSLTSPHTVTRWLILQKARRHPSCGLRLLVGARFQVLFHSPPGVLFTFPSRYCSSIGHQVVFWLGGWSPRLPTGFLVPRGTLDPAPVSFAFGYMALTFSGGPSQTLLLANSTFPAVRNPKHIATFGLASSDFARHYFRNLG